MAEWTRVKSLGSNALLGPPVAVSSFLQEGMSMSSRTLSLLMCLGLRLSIVQNCINFFGKAMQRLHRLILPACDVLTCSCDALLGCRDPCERRTRRVASCCLPTVQTVNREAVGRGLHSWPASISESHHSRTSARKHTSYSFRCTAASVGS